MGHTFPKRKLRNREFVHRSDWTETMGPLTEKLAGGLGEQDLSSTEAGGGKLIPVASLSDDAYYAAYEAKEAVSMDLNVGGHHYAKVNTAGAPAGATILDSQEWQPLVDAADATRLEKTIACGEDILCVFACLQAAGWLGDLGTATDAVSDETHRLQYALRLDGSVISDTITGPAYYPDPPPRQIYTGVTAVSTVSDFDYRHKFWQHNGTGLPNYLQPARLTRTFPVVEGSHTVDVVARRVPRSDGKIDNGGTGSSIQVFNRRLFVLRLKGWSKFSGSGSLSLSVEGWGEGEVVSNTSLMTNRVNKLRDALNDVTEPMVARGAFRNEHLPSVVYFPSVTTLTPAAGVPLPANDTYAGYGSPLGWQVVGDGAGNTLFVDAGGGGFTLTGNSGVLVVLANVQVKRIWVAASNEARIAGVFLIRYRDSTGTWNYLGETEAVLTPRNPTQVAQADGSGTFGPAGMNPCEDDVPLMWVVDTRALLVANPNASTIQRIEVVAATHTAFGLLPAGVNMETQRAILTAFLLRGVTLG